VRFTIADALDLDILRMMRASSMTRLSDAEWFCGAQDAAFPDVRHEGEDRWFGRAASDFHDPDVSLARRQAVASYPALAMPLMAHSTEVIDARAPLAPEVARLLGVEEAQVRLVQGLTWQRAGVRPSDPRAGLARIASVPMNFRPVTRAEHRQLPLIDGLAQLLDLDMPAMMRGLAIGGSPYRFGEALKATAPGDIADAGRYIVDKLIRPARLHAIRDYCEATRRAGGAGIDWSGKIKEEVMLTTFLQSLSPKDLFEMSARWHRNLQRHDDRLVSINLERRWTPLIGHLDCSEKVTARELCSAADLKRQGRKEGHCVGGYAGQVIDGNRKCFTMIFSLEAQGDVIGTVEFQARRRTASKTVKASSAGWDVEIVQNRGKRNGPVGREAGRAAEILRARLASMLEFHAKASHEKDSADPVETYLRGIGRARRRSRSDALPDHVRQAGYDIWDRRRLEASWEELSVYLPRRIRKAGLDAFIATQDLTGESFSFTIGKMEKPFWEKDVEAIASFQRVDAEENEDVHSLADDFDETENDEIEYDQMPF
jgi:hypothetical protein